MRAALKMPRSLSKGSPKPALDLPEDCRQAPPNLPDDGTSAELPRTCARRVAEGWMDGRIYAQAKYTPPPPPAHRAKTDFFMFLPGRWCIPSPRFWQRAGVYTSRRAFGAAAGVHRIPVSYTHLRAHET